MQSVQEFYQSVGFLKIFIALLFVIISLHKNNNMTNQFYFCFLGVFILCSSDQLWAGK